MKQGGLRARIRHFYDLHYLLQDADCRAYLESEEFVSDFGRLLAEDRERFAEPSGWQLRTLAESPLVTEVVLDANGDVRCINVEKGRWHSLECLESGSVLLESKDGAYAPLGEEDVMG